MRRVRYLVAMSLDGYIAGAKGEADWIILDPDIDFEAILQQFDTVLLGRRTFDIMQQEVSMFGSMKTIVFSKTLRPEAHAKTTIISQTVAETIQGLRSQAGKDIWLMGGGELFRSLLDLGLVDTVEVSVIPGLLGCGIPLLPPMVEQKKLKLTGHRVYKTGIVSLQYAIEPS